MSRSGFYYPKCETERGCDRCAEEGEASLGVQYPGEDEVPLRAATGKAWLEAGAVVGLWAGKVRLLPSFLLPYGKRGTGPERTGCVQPPWEVNQTMHTFMV